MLKRLLRCFPFHEWLTYQEIFVTHTGASFKYDVIIAWKICKKCAKSKLIHILK